ncbi:1-phosphofructokinase family hexose kinase [Antarcticibacterium sp. 1MA-6-2]|uniref:1-phosphofructokinase family hexose kinase n=1 Tax=Antarcticibacterium sp. 1MA-6-2 TaxID=2908210 RepID=UPI001F261F5A|nr:1-phosphofructokinase family hexose kinase [Antarcticibacterium sp. 1MA-6-2]UJH90186.1 1-phosphofructokinase family hexose kinase [Antarcticibacterium sp. 1MA-6-2]
MILSVCPNPSIDCYAWLEEIKPGEVNRIERIQEYPGGKGVHIAFAIKELGGKTTLFGTWAGGTGEWIRALSITRGIEILGVSVEGNNRKCYTLRSSNPAHSNTEILEPGPEINYDKWQEFKSLFKKEISNSSLVCLSGSWPKGAPGDAYAQLVKIANENNKKIFLDCSGPQLLEALKSSFFALHINEHEAHQFCGSTNFKVLLEKLDNRVDLVAMTKGKEGLMMWYKGKIYCANVEIENVLSTVGSGDCLTAGISWAYEKGLPPEDMAAYGVACGAANCQNEELGMLRKNDVETLFPKVKLKILENEF